MMDQQFFVSGVGPTGLGIRKAIAKAKASPPIRPATTSEKK
jgi:hypothetical protein